MNGSFVQEGPCKGDLQTWYFDRADITSFLHAGENVVAAEVLRYPADRNRRNHSLIRTEVPCLYVADEQIRTKGDEQFSFQGKSGWKCMLTKHIHLVAEPARPAPLHILENAEGEESLHGWKKPGFDDSGWQDGKPYSFFDMNQAVSPWNLAERTIPAQRHRERRFCGAVSEKAGAAGWTGLLQGKESLRIPANTKSIVKISAGELMTGYRRHGR